MKIGYVAKEVHRHGGMERAAAEVLTRLAQRHDVVVAAEQCEIKSDRLRWLPVKAFPKPALINVISFRHRAAKLLELCECDLVGSIGASAVEADVVTAQFCHAAFTARFGGLRGGRGLARRVWQRYVQSVFWKHEHRIYTSHRLKRVIAVSKGTARELIEFYGVDPTIISVIPNAVDHETFKPASSSEEKLALRRELGIAYDGMLAIFVGGDWDRKGVADAIRAIGKTPDVHLAVVGRWNAEPYREIAKSVGAERRVYFPGASRSPEKWMAAGDVFVFPSRYEAFSLVMIEAAACGLPLLVTKINGSEELVEDGVNGIFIRPDPDDIADNLSRLAADTACRARMAKAALDSSLSYNWDDIFELHEEAYLNASGHHLSPRKTTVVA